MPRPTPKPKPKPAPARDAYLGLVRVHEKLAGQFSDLFRDHGLTQPQYNVLRILAGGPDTGVSCHYVGERLLNRLPDVTRLIDRMEATGLVKRSRSTEDRRVVLIRLTAKGRKVCEGLAGPVMDLHKRQFAQLTPGRLEVLTKCLQEVLEGS